MQALILVGGEGTRLRPLTSTVPKPVVQLVDRPFITYMIEWLRGHGVDDVVLACGFMPDGVRAVLGDGSALGIRLRYVEEPSPLGTGGALKYAEDLLDERFFMLNGDQFTDLDLTAQLRQHESTGAKATLALIPVADPSAYGLVRRDGLEVREFLEKPSPDEIDTNLVNAGAYILERSVLATMPPAGTRVSIEREVFPALVGKGLYGYQASGYWMDIGTPERYLQASYDILEGGVETAVGREVASAGGVLVRGERAGILGTVHGPALVGSGCQIARTAVVSSRTVLGDGVSIGEGAHVESSVLLDGAQVGANTRIVSSIIGPRAEVGSDCRIEQRVMLGEDVRIGSGNTLMAGMRLFPRTQLGDTAVAF